MRYLLILLLLLPFSLYAKDEVIEGFDKLDSVEDVNVKLKEFIPVLNEELKAINKNIDEMEADIDDLETDVAANEGKFMVNSSDTMDYADGQIDADSLEDNSGTLRVGKLRGSWASKNVDTVYQAATDGVVCAVYYSGSTNGDIYIKTDSSNPPTTIRVGASANRGTTHYPGACCPVRDSDYYEVDDVSLTVDAIYWIPLGN